MPIERMLREPIRPDCAIGALQLELRAMAQSRTNRSADGDGASSAPWFGYTAFADCAHDISDEQTSTRHFSHVPARSSVGSMSNGVVRRS
jgi:hypothetical protein